MRTNVRLAHTIASTGRRVRTLPGRSPVRASPGRPPLPAPGATSTTGSQRAVKVGENREEYLS